MHPDTQGYSAINAFFQQITHPSVVYLYEATIMINIASTLDEQIIQHASRVPEGTEAAISQVVMFQLTL